MILRWGFFLEGTINDSAPSVRRTVSGLVVLFRNCPNELSPEKFGWITVMKEVNRRPQNIQKKIAIITDHDLDNHSLYNSKRISIFRNFYLPNNFVLIYGRGDGPNQNLLNYMVKQCDKKSSEILNEINEKGFCQIENRTYAISQIPVPRFVDL